jgi:hypothetical protein
LEKTDAFYTAKVDARCTTKESYAATTSWHLDQATEIILSGDKAALGKLLKAGTVFLTKAGVPVFVILEIRPQGEVGHVWITLHGVECAPAVEKATKR